MELLIQSIALKQQIGQCNLVIYFKSGESVQSVKVQVAQGQRLIKYPNPLKLTLVDLKIKYIHFFIQTEEHNYHKVLGSKRINLADLTNDQKVEKIADIEIEDGNVITLRFITVTRREQEPRDKKAKSIVEVTCTKCSKTIKDSQKKQVNTAASRRSPQLIRTVKLPDKMSALDECKMFLQNSNLNVDEEEEFKERLTEYSHQATQMTPETQVNTRVHTEMSNEKTLQMHRNYESASLEEMNPEYNSQIHSRISNLELLVSQKLQQRSSSKSCRQERISNANQEIWDDQFYQYKQMMKELALLLDVTPDCSSLVMAVQRLVQRSRQQTEQIIKIQCENQVLQQHLQNITLQQSLVQDRHQDLQKSIKQKLNIYQSLFEENVQLKSVLKQDLQKIVELKIELKQLKSDTQDQLAMEKQINQLHQDLQHVCSDVDEKRKQNQILHEEISLLQQFVDESLNSQDSV